MKYILDHNLRNVLSNFSKNGLVQIQEYGFGLGLKKNLDFVVPVFDTLDEVLAYYVDEGSEVFEVFQKINAGLDSNLQADIWDKAVLLGHDIFLQKQTVQRGLLFEESLPIHNEEIYCVKQVFPKNNQDIKTDNYYFFTTNKDLAQFAAANEKRFSQYHKKHTRTEVCEFSELANKLQMQ